VAGAELLGSIVSKELKNGAEGAACSPAALGQTARRSSAQQPFCLPGSSGLGWLPSLRARRNKLVAHGPTPLACASLHACTSAVTAATYRCCWRPGKLVIHGVHHVGVLISDLERSLKFYTEVLGALSPLLKCLRLVKCVLR
jgi:hypothetical protein